MESKGEKIFAKNMEKGQIVQEVGGGLIVATTLTGIVLFLLVLWSPASYYLGKWSDYWDNKDHVSYSVPSNYYRKQSDAYVKCVDKVVKFYGTTAVFASASSTSSDFSTYDCYGVKFNKIP